MSLKSSIRSAAASFPGLTTLLGTSPFRWYDERRLQGSVLPAVAVQIISGSPTYTVAGRLPTGWTRVQFTISGSGADSSNAMLVETQLLLFFDQLNLIGISGLTQYPAFVLLQKDAMEPQTEPPIFQRIVDANIFSNSKITG